ncbi:MAG: hypothetical protein ACI9G1_005391 [Pirellulaceae bacterium]|jgi:hypothetical protein
MNYRSDFVVRLLFLSVALFPSVPLICGCAAIPTSVRVPQVHNPFPQLEKVAVYPFYNQSENENVDGDEVSQAYYEELQKIPGFEVVPVGVTKRFAESLERPPSAAADFQALARTMGVDAIVVGSVTNFEMYYPPRMGLSVRWYSANPCYHEVPAGYGLPWGTLEEEDIPDSLVFEAEFALAKEQLKTQTPSDEPKQVPLTRQISATSQSLPRLTPVTSAAELGEEMKHAEMVGSRPQGMPPNWPDPRGFVPVPPQADAPVCRPHYDAVIRHTRLYDGRDPKFTQALSEYYHHADDARFGGWQSYLKRSDDFIQFCCHTHIYQTLSARGGADETRVAWRWPISRYEP